MTLNVCCVPWLVVPSVSSLHSVSLSIIKACDDHAHLRFHLLLVREFIKLHITAQFGPVILVSVCMCECVAFS